MYLATIPNRNSRPAVLLRESYREGGTVKNRTLANLTEWPAARIEGLRQVLRGTLAPTPVPLAEAFEIVRSRPHGHVAAVLGTIRRLGLDRVLSAKPGRPRQLVLAMLVARRLEPRS
jgi:hypothetical protein